MTLDHDLENGVPHQGLSLKATPAPLKDDNQKTPAMSTDLKTGGTSNPPRSDHLMATVLIFDKSSKRHVHEQQETESASPVLPGLKIVLRRLNARKFEDELSSNEKSQTCVTPGNVEEAAEIDHEIDKIARRFFVRLYKSNTNKVPTPPCLGTWELFRLWKHDCDDWFWINDPILGSAKLEIEVMNEPRLLHRSHMLYLTTYGSAFSILPSAMRMKCPSEEHLLVECKFLHWPGNLPYASYLPLSTRFQNLLESEESATALFDGNMQVGAKLVSLDMLRATIDCWWDFLASIRRQSIASDFEPDWYQLQHDKQHVRGFAQMVRDIGRALEATLVSIAEFHEIAPDRRRQHGMIVHETRSKLSALNDVIQDVQSYYDNLAHVQDSTQNIAQAATLKRLTVFAAVFLPISLASSLLGMDTRAAALGLLWYDFFGISVSLGFIMYTVYMVSRKIAKLWVSKNIVGTLRLIRNFCWRILEMRKEQERENRRTSRQRQVAEGTMTAEEANRQTQKEEQKEEKREENQDKLRILFGIAKSVTLSTFHIFGIITTASFLVGMFKDVSIGLRIFGYGAAASLACGIFLILPYKVIDGILDMKFGFTDTVEFGIMQTM